MRRNRPSRTAIGVARGLLFASLDPLYAPLVSDRAASYTLDLLGAVSPIYRLDHRLMSTRLYRYLGRRSERRWARGGFLHVALRKRFFEDEVRAALEDRTRTQLVVVGGGFDTLAIRIAEDRPDLTVFEVDHPATQAKKHQGLARIRGRNGPDRHQNLHLVELDAHERSLGDALAAHPEFQPNSRAVVVAEGLLMYLEPEAVAELFRSIHALFASDTTLIFSYVSVHDDGRPLIGHNERMFNFMLRLVGEPFRWGVRRQELEEYVSRHGFRLDTSPTEDELRRRFLAGPEMERLPLLDWEYSAVAGSVPGETHEPRAVPSSDERPDSGPR